MQEIFIEFSSLHRKLCFFSKVFQTFKAFCLFDATFGSILKKYKSFATLHYSLVATSAEFAELKQFKSICPGNKHTHTDRLLTMHPRTTKLIKALLQGLSKYLMLVQILKYVFQMINNNTKLITIAILNEVYFFYYFC